MSQVNYGGENYQTQAGQGNINFSGGEHNHYYPQGSTFSDSVSKDSSNSLRVDVGQDAKLRRKNIFLEVFNPDSRLALGIYDDLDNKAQYDFLFKVLNASVFLCEDFVVVPPTFLLECPVVLKLIKVAAPFMAEGIIRMPMRDRSFSEFYEKKIRRIFRSY